MDESERNRKLRAEEKLLIDLPSGGDIPMAVGYPNRYWLAMSNLGFQTVYRLFACHHRFRADRAYVPESGNEWRTFETHSQLSTLELLALSVSFETDYLFVLQLLARSGLKLEECREVGRSDFLIPDYRGYRPFLLGGGAALTLNPEPLANFFDAICIGEGEDVVAEFAEIFVTGRDAGWTHRELLLKLADVEGLYIPALTRPQYDASGNLKGFSRFQERARPKRRYVEDIDRAPSYTVIQTPNTEFKSMFMTETGRGCEVGCKFCVAGYMYRPTRKHSADNIRQSLKVGLEASPSVGFVGAAVSSHRNIAELTREVAEQGKRAALSSIMSQRVTKDLAQSLTESEYKTVALAPEAGSEELRFRIGKRVRDEQIVTGVGTLAASGIRNFKLYFIVGLPSETDADVEAISELVRRCAENALAQARSQSEFRVTPTILLSVNPFIPKAWTPFQRHAFLPYREIKRRLNLVKQGIRQLANVEMKFESPRESYFQAVMSRGDRRVGDLLVTCYNEDADWKWITTTGSEVVCSGVPAADTYVFREFGRDEALPWESVDLRIDRELLEREYQRTFEGDVQRLISVKARKLEELRA